MSKKVTTEEFILKAKLVHEDKYDYSKVKYANKRTKIIITCKEHGDFEQRPSDHSSGNGCKKCATEYTIKKLTLNKEEVIPFLKEIMYLRNEKNNGTLGDRANIIDVIQ